MSHFPFLSVTYEVNVTDKNGNIDFCNYDYSELCFNKNHQEFTQGLQLSSRISGIIPEFSSCPL